jgi:hypothetical protein
MGLAAIEFNDTSVGLARDGVLLAQSPGYALLEEDALLVGEEALRQARIKPRLTSTRFWQRLSNDPVFPSMPTSASFADLARAHLLHIWTRGGADMDGLIFVVPASFDRQQLGLLLGIAEQLALPVRGMVDSALVACRSDADAGLVVHVDLHLHALVVTGVETGEGAHRVFHRSLEGYGLTQLYDRWVKLIADIFVQSTRFDPLHRAQSEQAIYDRLPVWLSALGEQDSMGVEMAARDGGVHVIRLARSQVIECADAIYQRLATLIGELCGQRPFALQLADGAGRLPGLSAALSALTNNPSITLPPGAGALGALRRAAQITAGGWHNTLTVRLAGDAVAGQVRQDGGR